jgi:hypothetical protein
MSEPPAQLRLSTEPAYTAGGGSPGGFDYLFGDLLTGEGSLWLKQRTTWRE